MHEDVIRTVTHDEVSMQARSRIEELPELVHARGPVDRKKRFASELVVLADETYTADFLEDA